MDGYGIKYGDLIRNFRIYPGDVLKIRQKDDNGQNVREKRATVAAVYTHHVLLDFGLYKESRKKIDIALRLSDVVGRA